MDQQQPINAREVVSAFVEAGIHAQGPQGLVQRAAIADASLKLLFALADDGEKWRKEQQKKED
jgi:hypothetical protein